MKLAATVHALFLSSVALVGCHGEGVTASNGEPELCPTPLRCDRGDQEIASEDSCLKAGDAKCYSHSACGASISCTGAGASGLIPDGITKVRLSRSGVFQGDNLPLPGSECHYYQINLEYDVVTKAVTYERCATTPQATPLTFERGTRTLLPSDEANLMSSLHALALTATKSCWADAGYIKVEIAGTKWSQLFVDAVSPCWSYGNVVYVDQMNGVLGAFFAAAFPVGAPDGG